MRHCFLPFSPEVFPLWLKHMYSVLSALRTIKRGHPQQLWTDNVFYYYLKNPDRTDNRRNLLLVFRGLFPGEQKGFCRRMRGTNIYRPAHPQRSPNEAERCSYGIDSLREGLWYSPANEYNTWKNHKLHYECHGKLKGGMSSWR